jgi:Dolichyl-phosphate-mannose-protein mannosyltransferase
MTIAEPGMRRYRPWVINVAGEQAGAGVGGTCPRGSRQRGPGSAPWPEPWLCCCSLSQAGTATTATSCTSLRAGSEPAFGYADQPPLTPLLAHALDDFFDGSLVGLRLPSALMAGLVVLLTGLLAREFGAGRGAQILAAGCMAVSAVLPVVSHMLSATTVDLLVWTAISWLVVRALRHGGSASEWSQASGCRTRRCLRSSWPRCWSEC